MNDGHHLRGLAHEGMGCQARGTRHRRDGRRNLDADLRQVAARRRMAARTRLPAFVMARHRFPGDAGEALRTMAGQAPEIPM